MTRWAESACWWIGARFYRLGAKLAARRRKGLKVVPFAYSEDPVIRWIEGREGTDWRSRAN